MFSLPLFGVVAHRFYACLSLLGFAFMFGVLARWLMRLEGSLMVGVGLGFNLQVWGSTVWLVGRSWLAAVDWAWWAIMQVLMEYSLCRIDVGWCWIDTTIVLIDQSNWVVRIGLTQLRTWLMKLHSDDRCWVELAAIDWVDWSMVNLLIEWWSHRFDHGWYWSDIDKYWSIIELSRSSLYKSVLVIDQQQHLHVELNSRYSIASNSTSLNSLIQCWLHRCELSWGCTPIDTIDSTADLNSQASIAYVDDHA
mgnify:CR=1 FL=1